MLDSIIRFSIKNKLIIGLFTLLLIIWGSYSLRQLPVDAVPDITNNQVQIITTVPTLASQEVEQFVTYPIEQRIANLPDLEEIRSISRFGLSVITVVFDDKVDIYFARQLINEQLKNIAEALPPGVGSPQLAPVSTGLGEVYQYVLHPRKGSEHKYTAMDLRTMQDWIVARQLYGTPGIAEINSFGGLLKQYEVAVDPDRLKAMNVTIPELVTALERNNENTGGAYIDKKPYAYFIRGIGMLRSLEDVGRIVIKNPSGVPVLVKDVAVARLGSAVRYGALTRNGESESVGGIVMMLKGHNSAAVVERVKEKMVTIRKSLPEDIVIEPILDRTNLVNRAIATVEKNLVEGALIVIFVLVLFLGNLRAGLIVASAIPLSMLFALGMMHVFGVSANLMSLGAIDFGLIVDGAVIIVEATMHHLGLRKATTALSQEEMDEEVFLSASKIRNSAAFGEIIILIVYLPILSLSGIEGKMFRPMAQTVGFAIFGALILSLTYIPMMSALLLPRRLSGQKHFSDRIMERVHAWYRPVLERALHIRRIVIGIAVACLAGSLFLFSRMGGEFLPQLQEGDFAFHCILPQGASLSQSIETSMQASRLLLSFSEVKQVIGKTGSAEVPTDPMPPEATDLIIVLKDKKEWTSTKNDVILAQKMIEKLEELPGVFFEVNQPIQMRFNELMTGVRQDVAVKLFGEDLDTLNALAPRIAAIIDELPGATAPQIERTAGLPQITVSYDRGRIANYGLNISDINTVLSTAFAGSAAGVVFENERKFDLVVRLDSSHRSAIQDVSSLLIPTPDGSQIPLSQLATVSMQEGPAQISREQARRRIVIGFNVRGRDVQSVVRELQERLNSRLQLPSGYYLSYGGTFEHLEQANARLRIAVPLALLLIFILLYFSFRSLRQALLIFSAIPMSAIGGILALCLRDMPFSISAGVGFIALFGVAVLNGIVLIGTFNQLEQDGQNDPLQRVREGTAIRLRPVLMTAMVASLGFLPMALSNGAGAEVQKPLATVVIGGLVSATLLTLLVLPLLYLATLKKNRVSQSALLLLALMACSQTLMAQDNKTPAGRITFPDAYERALQQNLQLKSSTIAAARGRALSGSVTALPKTGFFVENEDLRPSDSKGILKIGVSQSMEWPGLYRARKEAVQQQAGALSYARQLEALALRRSLQEAYYTAWYYENKLALWLQLDSIYTELARVTVLRVRKGESAGLDSIAAKAKSAETGVQVRLLRNDIYRQQLLISSLLHTDSLWLPQAGPLPRLSVPDRETSNTQHPLLLTRQMDIGASAAELKVARRAVLPELSGRFFSQRLYGLRDPFNGFSVSVGIPVLGLGSYRSRIAAARLEQDYQQSRYDDETNNLNHALLSGRQQLEKDSVLLDYYEAQGLGQATAILSAANLSYQAGEISFAELAQYLSQALELRRNYLDILQQYNQAAIHLSFYLSTDN